MVFFQNNFHQERKEKYLSKYTVTIERFSKLLNRFAIAEPGEE